MTFRSSAMLHPSSVHHPSIIRPSPGALFCQNSEAKSERRQKESPCCNVFGLQCCLMQLKWRRCCFPPGIDLVKHTFHQWGEERKKKKKRKCGNHYSNGDRGGISFGSLLGLFLPIYSISCCWPENTNLLQMILDVLLLLSAFKKKNIPCVHSVVRFRGGLFVLRVSSISSY